METLRTGRGKRNICIWIWKNACCVGHVEERKYSMYCQCKFSITRGCQNHGSQSTVGPAFKKMFTSQSHSKTILEIWPRTVCTRSDKHACGQHSQALTLKHDAKHGCQSCVSCKLHDLFFIWGSPRSETNADSSLSWNARWQEKFTKIPRLTNPPSGYSAVGSAWVS